MMTRPHNKVTLRAVNEVMTDTPIFTAIANKVLNTKVVQLSDTNFLDCLFEIWIQPTGVFKK